MLRDERWPVARLIPITSATGVEAREHNAASALLAVLWGVDEFGRTLLTPLGAPFGKSRALNANALFSFSYGRRGHPWYRSLTGLFDAEHWHGSGRAALAPRAEATDQ